MSLIRLCVTWKKTFKSIPGIGLQILVREIRFTRSAPLFLIRLLYDVKVPAIFFLNTFFSCPKHNSRRKVPFSYDNSSVFKLLGSDLKDLNVVCNNWTLSNGKKCLNRIIPPTIGYDLQQLPRLVELHKKKKFLLLCIGKRFIRDQIKCISLNYVCRVEFFNSLWNLVKT